MMFRHILSRFNPGTVVRSGRLERTTEPAALDAVPRGTSRVFSVYPVSTASIPIVAIPPRCGLSAVTDLGGNLLSSGSIGAIQ
jgi:hypothetical protein